MANLLYGAGLRFNECLQLRVKDVDFAGGKLIIRKGKGNKDRVTLLPQRLKPVLDAHLDKVKTLHAEDLTRGLGEAMLPQALAVKAPMRDIRGRGNSYFPLPNIAGTLLRGVACGFTCTRKRWSGPMIKLACGHLVSRVPFWEPSPCRVAPI